MTTVFKYISKYFTRQYYARLRFRIAVWQICGGFSVLLRTHIMPKDIKLANCTKDMQWSMLFANQLLTSKRNSQYDSLKMPQKPVTISTSSKAFVSYLKAMDAFKSVFGTQADIVQLNDVIINLGYTQLLSLLANGETLYIEKQKSPESVVGFKKLAEKEHAEKHPRRGTSTTVNVLGIKTSPREW